MMYVPEKLYVILNDSDFYQLGELAKRDKLLMEYFEKFHEEDGYHVLELTKMQFFMAIVKLKAFRGNNPLVKKFMELGENQQIEFKENFMMAEHDIKRYNLLP